MRYEHLTLDEERALYGVKDAEIVDCRFDGPADGESAMKDAAGLTLQSCYMNLRYPLWHVHGAEITSSEMTENCRAALWYDRDVRLTHCRLHGIKAVRECDDITLEDCDIRSPEFGWLSRGVRMANCTLESEYPFFQSRDITLDRLKMKGKYSFQYVENMVIRDCVLDTKDAFWHGKNVTVVDSVVKGEYLAWYSENLRLVRCRIIGTQPLCYARGLVLEDCEMVDADLAFERSEVQATVRGTIDSVKNPQSGRVEAESIGEVILDGTLPATSTCQIVQRAGERSDEQWLGHAMNA